MSIVTNQVHGGSKALRLTYQGVHVNDNSNSRLIKSFAAAPEIYARYYYRTEPIPPATQSGYTAITAKQHYLKVDGTSPDGYPNFVINHFWGSRELAFSVQEAFDCPPVYLGGPGCPNDYGNMASVPLQDNRWYCIEYHIKMNTPNVANGVHEIWVDGVQTFGLTNRIFRDTVHANAAFTELTVYRQGSDDMYRYEDDFVLATTRVGCSGNPSADSTPPRAPIGLSLQ